MTCIHHWSILQSSLPRKSSVLHLLIPPNPQLLATPELFTVSILLPISEYHIVRIAQYVGFSYFPLHRPEAVATTLECTALETVRVIAFWEEQSKERGPKQAAKAIPPVWGKGRQVGAGSRRALYAGVHHSILPRCAGITASSPDVQGPSVFLIIPCALATESHRA